MQKLILRLKGRSKPWVVGVGLIGIAIVGLIDYLTGPGVRVSILYVLVVVLVAWFANTSHGVWIAAVATVVCFLANLYSPITTTEILVAGWNSVVDGAVLLAICWLVGTVKKASAQRRHLERQVLERSDQERRRIAQDLHDGLCQHLAATEFATQLLTDKLVQESLPQATEARQIVGFIQRAMTQARDVAHGLNPVEIGPGGLMAALHELSASVQNVFHIACEVQANGVADFFDDKEATHVYRIVQEAVANAIKHGKPTRILIELRAENGRVILTVNDNGLGFPEQIGQHTGMGIGTMNYRASVIGAALTVHRGSNGGTSVVLSLPRDIHARARNESWTI
jgi:signal transduction histidine kinase